MFIELLLAASLCLNRVMDKAPHPQLPYVLNPQTLEKITAKPPVGVPFLDPSFGTIMTRITGAPLSEGANAVIKPMYSTIQPWNADESLLILWHRGKGHELYFGDEPYTFIRNLGINPTDLEHVVWDPTDPLVFYYPTLKNQERNQLIKVTLAATPDRTPTEEIIADFSSLPTACPLGSASRFGLGGDPEIQMGPRRLIGLMCGSNGRTKIVYSIAENKLLIWGSTDALGPIAPAMTPSEKLVYFGGGYVLDLTFAYQRRLVASSYFEHSQVGDDARGDTWNAIAFNQSSPGANDQGTLVSHSLSDGSRRVIIGPATGWYYTPAGTHISSTGPKGWVFVGSVGGAHDGQITGDNELMLANTDTGEVCRVGHNRTWAGTYCGPNNDQCPWGYWSETHGSLSRKGTRAIFASDWKGSASVDTYILDLRKPPIRMRSRWVCSILSLNPAQTQDCVVEAIEVLP